MQWDVTVHLLVGFSLSEGKAARMVREFF